LFTVTGALHAYRRTDTPRMTEAAYCKMHVKVSLISKTALCLYLTTLILAEMWFICLRDFESAQA